MPRAKNSPAKRKRHKKWIKRAAGYRGRRSTVFKLAKEATLKAGQYAYRDRRHKKNDFRKLWQIRINAAVRQHNLSYSKFIHGLRENKIELDRKVLAQIAERQPELFQKVVESTQTKQTK
jgi:large subunit ribosomal protein L20